MKPALHPHEADRLRELRRYHILDTEREREFDELVEITSEICNAPVSVVNFIDEGRQWFKAEIGLGVRSTPLETSLCGHVILQGDFVEIPDTLNDSRMADNPLCTDEPGFRFYAGAVLKGTNGLPLGTLCVLDHKPRTLSDHQRKVLRVLSRHIMRELDLRIALNKEQTLRREVDHRVKNSLASIGSLKHGFGIGCGSITVAIETRAKGWSIFCRDDGSATAQDAERATAGSGLGTRVIQSLGNSMGTEPVWRADGTGMELSLRSSDI